MSNSPLISCTILSPNNSGKRTMAIDRITPHCVVGQLTASALGSWFAKSSTQASSNYGIGRNGEIGMYVPEEKRSWCSSSAANDQRAVTIECASATTAPYIMNDAVYNSLVKLCVDICKRNGKTKLVWIANKDNALKYQLKDGEMLLTVHRWFANKSCPGDWLYNRLSDLAKKVTEQLTPDKTTVLEPGAALTLKLEPLYVSATTMTKTSTITGTYYYWGGGVVNGRIRITNSKSRVNVTGQVTGWITAPKAYVLYKVKAGDTLSKIAAAYKTTVAILVKENNIANANLIHVGDVLKIPV